MKQIIEIILLVLRIWWGRRERKDSLKEDLREEIQKLEKGGDADDITRLFERINRL